MGGALASSLETDVLRGEDFCPLRTRAGAESPKQMVVERSVKRRRCGALGFTTLRWAHRYVTTQETVCNWELYRTSRTGVSGRAQLPVVLLSGICFIHIYTFHISFPCFASSMRRRAIETRTNKERENEEQLDKTRYVAIG